MKSPRQVLLQVLEEKYTTQRHIQESLQGRIMELTAQLELQLHARPATTPPSTDSESHTPARAAARRAWPLWAATACTCMCGWRRLRHTSEMKRVISVLFCPCSEIYATCMCIWMLCSKHTDSVVPRAIVTSRPCFCCFRRLRPHTGVVCGQRQ